MLRRLLVIVTLGVGLIHPTLAAGEPSKDTLRMKERLIALSRGKGSVADLRIELFDGARGAHRSYLIADGKIVKRERDASGPSEKREEWTVTDEKVRTLLRDLVATQYWTFEGTRFTPDNAIFLFRVYSKGLPSVDYRCDADEYEASPPRSAIRSLLLQFVSGAPSAAEQPHE